MSYNELNESIIIFSTGEGGHIVEYVQHLIDYICESPTKSFFFILDKKLLAKDRNFSWNKNKNIHFIFFTDKEKTKLRHQNPLIKSIYQSIYLRRKSLELNASNIFLIELKTSMPFLSFLAPKRTKISGIIYDIFSYNKSMGRLRRFFEKLWYYSMVRSSRIKNILILNDNSFSDQMNKKYNTDKFQFLPDPVPSTCNSKVVSLIDKFGLNNNDRIFLHFGSLQQRKGCLTILQSIKLLNPIYYKQYVFIFAGKVESKIKDIFYNEYYECINKGARILLFDEFCKNEFLNNLCYTSDYILIPYLNTNQSSGIIGYSAFYRKPVIGPDEGLIGHLIKKYRLGIAIKDLDKFKLAEIYAQYFTSEGSDYIKTHTVKDFSNIILSCLEITP